MRPVVSSSGKRGPVRSSVATNSVSMNCPLPRTKRRAGEESMRIARRLVEEEVLHDDAFHGPEASRNMLGVGIGLGDILALDVKALERPPDRLVHHIGNAQAWLVGNLHAPEVL